MFKVKYSVLVPYNVKQMFDLVNDINSYSKFIPGCRISKILEQHDDNLIAEMCLSNGLIVKSLITHNIYIINKSIMIFLIKGPFQFFYGHWKFTYMANSITVVEYFSRYEFCSMSIEKFFHYVFKRFYGNIVKIFVSRANEIYG